MKQEELSKIVSQVIQTVIPPKMTLELAKYDTSRIEQKARVMGIKVVSGCSE